MHQRLVPMMLLVHDMFFDSSDNEDFEDDPNRKSFVVSIQYMNTRQFKLHFRMDIDTFEDLVHKLSSVYTPSRLGHPEVSLEESCLICLWYLSNIESFRGVAARFGVSKSTAWSAVLRICRTIHLMNQRFKIINWPSQNRCETISNLFMEKHQIPGVIGVIDGSHIKIVAPTVNPVSYINRKGFPSVILQAICDHTKLFTDVYIGEAGSVHDYAVFLRSDVSRRHRLDYPNGSHLLGDLAYKVTTEMLVGFKNNGHLSNRQKNFNIKLSKARVIIENAFALLKGRFRRLKFVESIIPENICHVILSATILHNICILKGDSPDNIMDIQEEIMEEQLNNPHNDLDVHRDDDNRQAHIKRNDIMNALLM